MFELHPKLKEDTVTLGQFDLSLVLLHKDANYPWCILVPKRENMREIHHLSEDDRIQLIRESCHLSEVMTGIFAPDNMNVAELGNMVPQLHLHHVARYKTDKAWPAAIWGATKPEAYTVDELDDRVARLQTALAGEGFKKSKKVKVTGATSEGFTP